MANNSSHIIYVPGTTTIMYHYHPSIVAAVIFVGVFGISTILHTYQIVRSRALYMIPMLVGLSFEVLGYIGRTLSSTEAPDCSIGPYIIQAIFILIAPALFAASIYMMLGHIILAVDGEQHSPIKQRFLTTVFILGDVFSLTIQSTGANIVPLKKKNAATFGKWIIVGGLVIQLIYFSCFIVVSAIFYFRLNKTPTHRSQAKNNPWRLHMFALFAVSILIWVRSVIRAVEYVQGTNGYILSHEIWLYLFDATLMSVVVLLYNIFHPSQITGLIKGRGAMYQVLRFVPSANLVDLEDEEKVVGRGQVLNHQLTESAAQGA